MGKMARRRRGSSLRPSRRTPPPHAGEDKKSHGAKTRAPKAKKKTGAELTEHLGPWQFKPGNCVNPAGGPKTARRVLNDDFIADLQEAWKISGKALIETAIKNYPDVFLYAN